jgi:PadR family transcriptional regulator PadR
MGNPRMTQATQMVLRVLLEKPTEPAYGLELARTAGLPSGTIHPILARLEHEYRWLESYLEDVDPTVAGRPPRRYYCLTREGAECARIALAATHRGMAPKGSLRPRPGFAGS